MTQHDTNPGKPRQCGVCGRHLPPDAPGGNCPTCLWALLADDGEDLAGEEVLQRFGSYELLEELARGGMGVVWKARQHGLRRYVALKTILEGHLASSEQVLRFYTEARAAASLDHPGIVPIYEIGEDEGRHFYSMMLMEGGSLADVMRSNIRLAPREAARLVVTVARALHFAHQRGVLHRDVKPSNILLDLEGRPRLADFGLARIADAESSVTRSLTALGTPAYMAPEQTSGKSSEVTTAADIHGLGVVLYELLTGSVPFLGNTPLETVKRLLETEAPPPRARVPEIDRDLEVICLRCLQKRPERRYASAADLADDLERWLAGEPISARPVSTFERLVAWARRKPELAGVLGLLGVVLVGAFVTTLILLFQVQRESDARSVALRAEESQRLAFQSLATIDENPGQALMLAMEATARGSALSARNALLASLEACRESRRFLGHEKVVRKVEFSPDGARLATASQDGTARIWSVGGETPPVILNGHAAWVRSASFSPDGSKIVTAGDDHTARVWDAGNGRELLNIAGLTGKVRDAQFTPDGQHVFVICSGGAILANASSGEVQQIFDPGDDILTCATLSPDGSRVVTGRGDGEARVWHVVRGSLLATLPRHTDRVFSVAFSGDGKTLVTASEPEAYVWNAESFEQISVLRGHSYGIYDLALTRDGKILATGSEDFTARIWEAHTGKLLHTLQHGHKVIRVQLSRDETLLLTASYDTTARIWNLSTGAPVAEFRGHAAPLLWAAFSPEGRTAATACVDYTARLWNVGLRDPLVLGNRFGQKLTNADRAPGGHLLLALPARSNTPLLLDGATLKVVRSLTGHEGPVEVGSFSPDGTLVASGAADSTARIWDVATGKSLCVLGGHEGPLIAAVFSLDQRHVGTAALTGPARVWSVPEGSLEATCTPKNPIGQIRFSPSSTALLVADTGGWLRILNIVSGQAAVFDVEDPIACAVFDRNETELATVVGTTRVQIRDARKRQVTGALVHLARVSYMAASSDHRWIATLALDATARVWDFPARKCVLEIRRRHMIPQRARFAADGTSLVVSWIVEGERDSGLSETVFYPLDVETSARAAYFGELTPDERDHFQVGSDAERLEQRKAWRGGHIFGVDG